MREDGAENCRRKGDEQRMREPDDDTLLFFDAHRDALPLFAALEEWIFERFPEAKKRVQKTQITYYHRHVFACVSFARVKRKAELPAGWLTLTLGLPYPPRIGAGRCEDGGLSGPMDDAFRDRLKGGAGRRTAGMAGTGLRFFRKKGRGP